MVNKVLKKFSGKFKELKTYRLQYWNNSIPLQYKTTALMIFIGVLTLLLLTLFYVNHNRQVVIHKELENIRNISAEIALHMDSHLKANAALASTLASAFIIRDALRKSNAEYSSLSKIKRKDKIDALNRQWKESKDIKNFFIQKHLTNPAAKYLKLQQIIIPELYGEIFLTNRYGAMIASTGKLTTLAHDHKYWWKAGYHNGEGRVFFDDRGFDTSVDGYVIGVVVPIKDSNEIIGILKCNINIKGPMTNIIDEYLSLHPGNIRIVRTKGLIVIEKGKIPLSSRVPENLVKYLQTKKMGDILIEEKGKKEFVAFSPISITMGSEKFGFGGNYESIDHIKGNEGEGWHIVITLDEEIVLKEVYKTIRLLIMMGIVFTIMTSGLALFLGKWITKPLIILTDSARKIGQGNLDIRVSTTMKDEIGILALEFNRMTENLEKTLISRDKLVREVESRKKAEETTSALLQEKEVILKEVHHRIKNNMMTMIGLLSLQSDKVKSTEAINALQDAGNRIQSMLVLYNKLYDTSDFQNISIKIYLQTLIEEVIDNFPQKEKVKIETNIDDFTLDTKSVFNLGIIINELITNTMKYAFAGRDTGKIIVSASVSEDNITIIYQDNGIGVPESISFENSTGFGFKLVSMLIKQLQGKIQIERLQGTKFIIKLNIGA